jgi:hypothetical protein
MRLRLFFTTKGTKVHKENLKGILTLSVCPAFVLFVSFVVKELLSEG